MRILDCRFSRAALVASALLILAACAKPPPHPNRVPLSGAVNFRDLGGYATVEGRYVKRGLLFRSDDLSNLSRRDVEALAPIGLHRIYDLRSVQEREEDPNRLPAGNSLQVVEVPIYFNPLDPEVTREKIISGDVEEGEFKLLMIEAYRAYVLDYREELSTVLQGLAEPGGLPALIHCRHGKDRTGVAVAVTLRALGVPKETVMEDYLLSNKFLEPRTNRLSCLASGATLFQIRRSDVRDLLEVRPEYLEAAFAAMDEEYGSFDNYLHEGLGIDDVTLEQLRSALLE